MEFAARAYQQAVLDSVDAYFRATHDTGDADTAFYAVTRDLWGSGLQYHPLAGFSPRMPYFCLRVPTGGGKTWLAAKAVQLVNSRLLRSEHSVILWLVPSKAIREQTLKGLRERQHPYHAALREAGPVTVIDLDEAKSLTRATLDSSTVVIVCTRQAFQVDDPEIRKVYESSGALMHHFDNLSDTERRELEPAEDGTIAYSLVNVLRLRRPFVIVDEAHNSRTELGFDTLARFRPSGIMELTATPDTSKVPSNVLHSVSAAELKTEEMIKLPILLETEADWQKCLAHAIDRREQLQAAAVAEQRTGAAHLRPVVLIQAQPRRKGVDTLDVDAVKAELIANHNIPEAEIVIATGDEKGLEQIDTEYAGGIASEQCPVKFVITQRALAEGWDCPSAYILVSMAELQSATAVEQLLGRVLRQPQARRRQNALLNQSYAFVVSDRFQETARALTDRLVEGAGFERREASEFVAAAKPAQQQDWEWLTEQPVAVRPVNVVLPEAPKAGTLKKLGDKVQWDEPSQTLSITAPLSQEEETLVRKAVATEPAREAIAKACEISRTQAAEHFQTPAELGERFVVPQMAVRVQGELVLFDDPDVLDYPWDISTYDANPLSTEIDQLNGSRISSGGAIDVTDDGHMRVEFLKDLQGDLVLAYRPEHWDEIRLATWLCRNIPDHSVTHASKRAFVGAWLNRLMQNPEFDLSRVNRDKFLIRDLLERRITELRQQAARNAYQSTLFGDDNQSNVAVNDDYSFEFHPYAYAPGKDYDGRFGLFHFRKHYYSRVGDFDSAEEFECACWLDMQAQRGRIQFWVRNLVRKEGCSFFLQKTDGRFYPDFLCQLPDGTVLAVEYKGANAWTTDKVKDDRMIGDLWEQLSQGHCRFVMVKDRDWAAIDAKL